MDGNRKSSTTRALVSLAAAALLAGCAEAIPYFLVEVTAHYSVESGLRDESGQPPPVVDGEAAAGRVVIIMVGRTSTNTATSPATSSTPRGSTCSTAAGSPPACAAIMGPGPGGGAPPPRCRPRGTGEDPLANGSRVAALDCDYRSTLDNAGRTTFWVPANPPFWVEFQARSALGRPDANGDANGCAWTYWEAMGGREVILADHQTVELQLQVMPWHCWRP